MKKYLILLALNIVSSFCFGMAEPTVVTNRVGVISAGSMVVDREKLEQILQKTAENAAREGFERGVEEGANKASTSSSSNSLLSPIKKVFSFIPWKYFLSGTGLAVIGGVIYWRIYGATPQQLAAVKDRVDAAEAAQLNDVARVISDRAAVLADATADVATNVAVVDGRVRGVAAHLREQQVEESEALRAAREGLEVARLNLLSRLGTNSRWPSALALTRAQDRRQYPEASLMDVLQSLDTTSLQNVKAFIALKDQLDGLAATAAADDQGHQETLVGLQERLRVLSDQFSQADQAAIQLHSSLDDAEYRVVRIRRDVTGRGGAGQTDLSLMARALLPPNHDNR